ncbi:MAG TPA: hypothetical protein VFF81_12155 [Noviherbaspirillum sp.]|nr:hypothetical protein [Noviherbaspirillum sp.]
MGWLRLNGDGTYLTGLNPTVPLAKAEQIDTKGRWSFDGKQFSWKGGWMEKVRSSKLIENGKDQQVILPRDENKQNGKPLIDTNDTKCTWKKA